MGKPAEMSKAMAEAIDGRVSKADGRHPSGATSKAVSEPVPPSAGREPVEPPIWPVIVAIRFISITRHDAARARVIEIPRGAGVVGGGHCWRRSRAAEHYRWRIIARRGRRGHLT
jgi:hypothetical protein